MFFIAVFELIITAYASLLWLRMLLQKGGLFLSHPMAQLCANLSDFLVRPMRRLIKPVKGWDTAIAVLSFVIILFAQLITLLFFIYKGSPLSAIMALLWVGNTFLLWSKAAAYALIICLIVQTVLSFSSPYNPLMTVMNRILNPLTRPFRFLRIGRIDFSGSLIFIILWLWVSLVVPYIQQIMMTGIFL